MVLQVLEIKTTYYKPSYKTVAITEQSWLKG